MAPTNEEMAKLARLRFEVESAQKIVDAWENDPSYPGDKHDEAVRRCEEAEEALKEYRNYLVKRYPEQKNSF